MAPRHRRQNCFPAFSPSPTRSVDDILTSMTLPEVCSIGELAVLHRELFRWWRQTLDAGLRCIPFWNTSEQRQAGCGPVRCRRLSSKLSAPYAGSAELNRGGWQVSCLRLVYCIALPTQSVPCLATCRDADNPRWWLAHGCVR